MKKSYVVIITVVAVIAIIVFWSVGVYNKLVVADESVKTAWSNVESQYQRRADLIPNLVNTVKGYAEHEQETLNAVVEARAKATQMNISAENLTKDNIKAYQEAQESISSSIGRLLMVSENYPDLKANKNFQNLQEQLEGTENRIQVARNKYNESTKAYNTMLRRFPNNIVAGMYGFESKEYFEATEKAAEVPSVEF